jgi:hypothetical protein
MNYQCGDCIIKIFSYVAQFSIEDFSHAMAIQNRRLRFARLNVFGLCRCLTVLSRSGKSKRDSNAISGCWENWETLCSCRQMTWGEPPRKSSSLIRAAKRFRPLNKHIGVDSVRKIETGLECDQRLLRKLKNTVTGAHCAMLLYEHSISQFSQQPLTPFEPSFDFPDRLDPFQLMQRPKTFRRANRRWRFPRQLASSLAQRLPHEDCVSRFSR